MPKRILAARGGPRSRGYRFFTAGAGVSAEGTIPPPRVEAVVGGRPPRRERPRSMAAPRGEAPVFVRGAAGAALGRGTRTPCAEGSSPATNAIENTAKNLLFFFFFFLARAGKPPVNECQEDAAVLGCSPEETSCPSPPPFAWASAGPPTRDTISQGNRILTALMGGAAEDAKWQRVRGEAKPLNAAAGRGGGGVTEPAWLAHPAAPPVAGVTPAGCRGEGGGCPRGHPPGGVHRRATARPSRLLRLCRPPSSSWGGGRPEQETRG